MRPALLRSALSQTARQPAKQPAAPAAGAYTCRASSALRKHLCHAHKQIDRSSQFAVFHPRHPCRARRSATSSLLEVAKHITASPPPRRSDACPPAVHQRRRAAGAPTGGGRPLLRARRPRVLPGRRPYPRPPSQYPGPPCMLARPVKPRGAAMLSISLRPLEPAMGCRRPRPWSCPAPCAAALSDCGTPHGSGRGSLTHGRFGANLSCLALSKSSEDRLAHAGAL